MVENCNAENLHKIVVSHLKDIAGMTDYEIATKLYALEQMVHLSCRVTEQGCVLDYKQQWPHICYQFTVWLTE
ncbi:hypothetical protein KI387_044261 [Taxus chinensis]|uniref:Uncharacterized protein n=1 Tax=Taxus chinensis TaxID=29808 RepID=A0AA38FCX4_TAXCH|nr:hypothetical protein KI387_044261 [Taxus chinensis]